LHAKEIKMVKNGKNNYYTLGAIIIIGGAAYFGFQPIFDHFQGGVVKEFITAIFGTIFTIVLTMFLLNKQTEVQESQERGQKIFEEKIGLYNKTLEILESICEGGIISTTEIGKIQFLLVKLKMVAGKNVINAFLPVTEVLDSIYNRDPESDKDEVEIIEEREEPIELKNWGTKNIEKEKNEKTAILKAMLCFSEECRKELGLGEAVADKDMLASVVKQVSKIQDELKKRTNATYFNELDGMLNNKKAGGKISDECLKLCKFIYNDAIETATSKSLSFKTGFTETRFSFSDSKTVFYVYPQKNTVELIIMSNQNKSKNIELYASNIGNWVNAGKKFTIKISDINFYKQNKTGIWDCVIDAYQQQSRQN